VRVLAIDDDPGRLADWGRILAAWWTALASWGVVSTSTGVSNVASYTPE